MIRPLGVILATCSALFVVWCFATMFWFTVAAYVAVIVCLFAYFHLSDWQDRSADGKRATTADNARPSAPFTKGAGMTRDEDRQQAFQNMMDSRADEQAAYDRYKVAEVEWKHRKHNADEYDAHYRNLLREHNAPTLEVTQ